MVETRRPSPRRPFHSEHSPTAKEGIVSKRKDSRYLSGRTLHWIKSKNPNAPAVKREAEIDWAF